MTSWGSVGGQCRAEDVNNSKLTPVRSALPTTFTSAVIGILLMLPAGIPQPVAASDETIVATFHAEGAQIYQCDSTADGDLTWQPREPIATLLHDGRTVGRHYAGPNWEHIDGSVLQAREVHILPAPSSKDLPWIKYQVTLRLGFGALSGTTTIRRINTSGGVAYGRCNTADTFLSVPYHADYEFLRPTD
jgi:Protein of unknown function (DUF3455)